MAALSVSGFPERVDESQISGAVGPSSSSSPSAFTSPLLRNLFGVTHHDPSSSTSASIPTTSLVPASNEDSFPGSDSDSYHQHQHLIPLSRGSQPAFDHYTFPAPSNESNTDSHTSPLKYDQALQMPLPVPSQLDPLRPLVPQHLQGRHPQGKAQGIPLNQFSTAATGGGGSSSAKRGAYLVHQPVPVRHPRTLLTGTGGFAGTAMSPPGASNSNPGSVTMSPQTSPAAVHASTSAQPISTLQRKPTSSPAGQHRPGSAGGGGRSQQQQQLPFHNSGTHDRQHGPLPAPPLPFQPKAPYQHVGHASSKSVSLPLVVPATPPAVVVTHTVLQEEFGSVQTRGRDNLKGKGVERVLVVDDTEGGARYGGGENMSGALPPPAFGSPPGQAPNGPRPLPSRPPAAARSASVPPPASADSIATPHSNVPLPPPVLAPQAKLPWMGASGTVLAGASLLGSETQSSYAVGNSGGWGWGGSSSANLFEEGTTLDETALASGTTTIHATEGSSDTNSDATPTPLSIPASDLGIHQTNAIAGPSRLEAAGGIEPPLADTVVVSAAQTNSSPTSAMRNRAHLTHQYPQYHTLPLATHSNHGHGRKPSLTSITSLSAGKYQPLHAQPAPPPLLSEGQGLPHQPLEAICDGQGQPPGQETAMGQGQGQSQLLRPLPRIPPKAGLGMPFASNYNVANSSISVSTSPSSPPPVLPHPQQHTLSPSSSAHDFNSPVQIPPIPSNADTSSSADDDEHRQRSSQSRAPSLHHQPPAPHAAHPAGLPTPPNSALLPSSSSSSTIAPLPAPTSTSASASDTPTAPPLNMVADSSNRNSKSNRRSAPTPPPQAPPHQQQLQQLSQILARAPLPTAPTPPPRPLSRQALQHQRRQEQKRRERERERGRGDGASRSRERDREGMEAAGGSDVGVSSQETPVILPAHAGKASKALGQGQGQGISGKAGRGRQPHSRGGSVSANAGGPMAMPLVLNSATLASTSSSGHNSGKSVPSTAAPVTPTPASGSRASNTGGGALVGGAGRRERSADSYLGSSYRVFKQGAEEVLELAGRTPVPTSATPTGAKIGGSRTRSASASGTRIGVGGGRGAGMVEKRTLLTMKAGSSSVPTSPKLASGGVANLNAAAARGGFGASAGGPRPQGDTILSGSSASSSSAPSPVVRPPRPTLNTAFNTSTNQTHGQQKSSTLTSPVTQSQKPMGARSPRSNSTSSTVTPTASMGSRPFRALPSPTTTTSTSPPYFAPMMKTGGAGRPLPPPARSRTLDNLPVGNLSAGGSRSGPNSPRLPPSIHTSTSPPTTVTVPPVGVVSPRMLPTPMSTTVTTREGKRKGFVNHKEQWEEGKGWGEKEDLNVAASANANVLPPESSLTRHRHPFSMNTSSSTATSSRFSPTEGEEGLHSHPVAASNWRQAMGGAQPSTTARWGGGWGDEADDGEYDDEGKGKPISPIVVGNSTFNDVNEAAMAGTNSGRVRNKGSRAASPVLSDYDEDYAHEQYENGGYLDDGYEGEIANDEDADGEGGRNRGRHPLAFGDLHAHYGHGISADELGYGGENVSRSPSPIRYARPDSRGNLSSSSDSSSHSGSSSPSSSSPSPSRTSSDPDDLEFDLDGARSRRRVRRRTQQPRSYRNSYRMPTAAVPFQQPHHGKESGIVGSGTVSADSHGQHSNSHSGSTPATASRRPSKERMGTFGEDERKGRSRKRSAIAEAVSRAFDIEFEKKKDAERDREGQREEKGKKEKDREKGKEKDRQKGEAENLFKKLRSRGGGVPPVPSLAPGQTAEGSIGPTIGSEPARFDASLSELRPRKKAKKSKSKSKSKVKSKQTATVVSDERPGTAESSSGTSLWDMAARAISTEPTTATSFGTATGMAANAPFMWVSRSKPIGQGRYTTYESPSPLASADPIQPDLAPIVNPDSGEPLFVKLPSLPAPPSSMSTVEDHYYDEPGYMSSKSTKSLRLEKQFDEIVERRAYGSACGLGIGMGMLRTAGTPPPLPSSSGLGTFVATAKSRASSKSRTRAISAFGQRERDEALRAAMSQAQGTEGESESLHSSRSKGKKRTASVPTVVFDELFGGASLKGKEKEKNSAGNDGASRRGAAPDAAYDSDAAVLSISRRRPTDAWDGEEREDLVDLTEAIPRLRGLKSKSLHQPST